MLGLAFWSYVLLTGPADVGVGDPSLTVTFGLCHTPSIGLVEAFQSDHGGWRRGCQVIDCVEVDLLHPRRKWVVWLWWGYVIDLIVCLLVLTRLCFTIGIFCGLPVCFRWSKFLGEWASLRNRMVLLWVCPVPPFWLRSLSTEYINCTHPATPLQRT